MKYANISRFIVLVLFSIFLYSCAGIKAMGGNAKNCGCGSHKGYVGY